MKIKIKTDDGHTITVTGPHAEELVDQLEEDLQELEHHRRSTKKLIAAAFAGKESWEDFRKQLIVQAEIMARDITFH